MVVVVGELVRRKKHRGEKGRVTLTADKRWGYIH
jgi:hypothetical protein